MDHQIITLKARLICESEADKAALVQVLLDEREAFNACSPIQYGLEDRNIKTLHNAFYHQYRETHPTVKCQIVVKAENSCLAAYRSIKSNKQKITKPITKKRLSIGLDHNLCRLRRHENELYLTTAGRRVKTSLQVYPRLEQYLKSDYTICEPLLTAKGGELWISLSFKVPFEEPKQTSAVGVDFGIRRFAATSEGLLFIDKGHNKRVRQTRHLKRSLQSKGTKSARKHLHKVRCREAAQQKNFRHNLANAIIRTTKSKVLVLEDLKTKSLKKKKHIAQNKNRISQVGFTELRRLLEYKAGLSGKTVVCVNPSYTSQIDSLTGRLEGERKGRRFYAVSGLVYDSDVSAALNIVKRSELPFSCARVLDGQGTVICPTACQSGVLR